MRWKTLNLKRTDNFLFVGILGVILVEIFFWFSPIREDYVTSTYLLPVFVAMILYLLVRVGLPRTPVALLPPVYAVWFFITRILNGDTYLYWSHLYVYTALFACCILFLVPFLANGKQRDRFLVSAALVYGVIVGIFAWVAVITSFTGHPWTDPLDVTRIIGINEKYANPYRLNFLGNHPNTSSTFFYTALGMLFIPFFHTKKIWLRIAYGILGVGLGLAVFLTGSISAIGVSGLMLGLVVFAVISARRKINGKRILLALLAVVVVAVVVVISYPMIMQWGGGLSQDVQRQEAADGEQPGDAVFAEERLNTDSMLVNMKSRFNIYSSAFLSVADRPLTLLIGEQYSEAMDRAARVINHPNFYHLHNSFLQTLVVGGGIAFLLVTMFTVLLVLYGARLFIRQGIPLYRKMLVLVPVALLCHSMTEPLLFVDTRLPNMMFFLLAGMIIAYAAETLTAGKQAEPVAVPGADTL